MKNYLVIVLLTIVLISCKKESLIELPPIKVGNTSESLNKITINKFTERKIILSGGNKKYNVAIENSKIATANIYKDTLKIKGLFQGDTFATIKSHSQEVQLNINVVSQEINISQELISLKPKDISKFVSVNGGGDIVRMVKEDPEDILNAKWNGETGILELKAYFEGEATIKFFSNNVVTKELKINVKSKGSADKIGIYSTTNKVLSNAMKYLMVVKRKNIGTWLSVSTNPYGIGGVLDKKTVAMFSSIKNPVKEHFIDLKVSFAPYVKDFANIKNGINKVYVLDVNEEKKTVLLRGRGFKLVLPYE